MQDRNARQKQKMDEYRELGKRGLCHNNTLNLYHGQRVNMKVYTHTFHMHKTLRSWIWIWDLGSGIWNRESSVRSAWCSFCFLGQVGLELAWGAKSRFDLRLAWGTRWGVLMLYIQVHLGTAHDAVLHAQIRLTPATSDLHLNCTNHAQYIYTIDGQSGELGVSLEGRMQRIMQLGLLRVVIVILHIARLY